MAGGEGTRLRPLTSNQPKPLVPIVGKPCMEHILELLRKHGFEDVIVTVAFLPQAIRSYFGSGESLGIDLAYSASATRASTSPIQKIQIGQSDPLCVTMTNPSAAYSNQVAAFPTAFT